MPVEPVTEPIDTTNDFLVGMRGDEIAILLPTVLPFPKDRALRLAAWLVALADPGGKRFPAVLDAVRST